MPEQPDPEHQKAASDAAPKSASSRESRDSSAAQAYIPLPARPPGKKRAFLTLVALIAVGLAAGAAYQFRQPELPPTVIVSDAHERVLTVTDADIAVAATERARAAPPALPADGMRAIPSMSAGGDQDVGLTPAPPPVVPPKLVSPAATAPQSALTPRGAEAVRSEGWSLFTMRLTDDVAQDGDVVQISIDDVPMSYLSLSHAGATLEIPLKKGQSHRIKVTAVRDGQGGVTLGLQTSAGSVVSRNMAVGESDTWIVDYK